MAEQSKKTSTSKKPAAKKAAPKKTAAKKSSAAKAGGPHTSHTTTDHDEIRKWAEARDGKPSHVKGTEHGKDDAGLIRLDFPGYSGDKLEEISWDDWFEKFEEGKLALVYQEHTADGKKSNFNKLVKR